MNDFRRIVLIGYRGAGKSTIGRLLQKKLEWEYISTDEQIEKLEEKTIGEIVEKNGWNYFRKLEESVIKKMELSQNIVIDTGGGIVESKENILKLKSASLMVWIDAQIEDIVERLQKHQDRPLLNKDNLAEDARFNYNKRFELYRQYSDLQFNTSFEKAETICDKIISEMRVK